ncbi:patatin-like phospholipase family protein [Haloplasma contractile]|uniref:PNPLA domain-containing protein n=1 Tax=Haloplasma contractile SSD-17B TaxID=1033810 RepID=U2EG35_9MOLU|nr:patatin-like phospholipase family protein [Haloplasma contractile]ERJ13873.1 Phospholipase putative protein [Haloplasma contractile SSD-17B]
MQVNIFFEGGGILGVCYLGAYKALMDRGFTIDKCIGISAGSIMSSLIIAGYTPDELIDIMTETDFGHFSSKTGLSRKTIVGKPMSLIVNRGIYDSQVIENWVESLLKQKGVRTFEDVMRDGDSRLHIIAADSTNKQALVIPRDLIRYGIKPESFPVAKAVRMSSAIPYYYTPVKIKQFNRINKIIDGAVVKNIPTDLVNHRLKNVCTPTLRFRVKKGKKNIKKKATQPLYNHRIYNHRNLSNCRGPFSDVIVIYNDLNIKSVDFNISRDKLNALYRLGYKSTEEYLIQHNNLRNCLFLE